MKKIYLYDLNMPSLMAYILEKIEQKGVEVISIDKLDHIEEDDNYPIVINPQSSAMVKHWDGIKSFISTHPNREIVMVTPDYLKEDLEKIIGVHSYVKIFDSGIDLRVLVEELTK